jgi:hypothetical protein
MKNLIAKLTPILADESLSDDEYSALNKFIQRFTSFLKLLSRDHTVEATDGKYDPEAFEKVFTGHIDPKIRDHIPADIADNPTAETKFERYHLKKKCPFEQLFGNANVVVENMDKTFFTKTQIKSIVENSPELLLTDGHHNFFFYENKRHDRFVLCVRRYEGKWQLWKNNLIDDDVWLAEEGDLIFLLQ